MSLYSNAVLLAWIIATAAVIGADIIDTLAPIVRYSPEPAGVDDYFGYSLVLHQLVQDGPANQTRIIVSAPVGQAVGTALPRGDHGKPTGVVYLCPIEPGDCEPLLGDGEGADQRLYDTQPNYKQDGPSFNDTEQKRGQFLGITLKSTGHTFMACAHRRQDFGNGSDRNPYGVCYYSGRDLRGFEEIDPCATTRSRSFFGFGQCQAGTAGDIIEDIGSGSSAIMLGLPGALTWRGAVARVTSQYVLFPRFSMSGVGTGSLGWQGYEMITGCINTPRVLDFIVSVPRFLNFTGRVNIYPNNNDFVEPVENPALAGDQIGAYYGYAMASVDFTGSNYDDLLVGAPMYSLGVSSAELGRVYVYRNQNGSLQLFTTLTGTIQYGRFGHAMAKLGDINGDGFEDVAISAPYGDQSGTVYIYTGAGASTLLNTSPQQVIVGSELNLASGLSNLRTFGSSLSSGVDVDGNGINDLAVGAYLSRQVFVLRTRPTVTLEVILTSDSFIDIGKKSCIHHGISRSCFNISACVQFIGTNLQDNMQINYTLLVDGELGRVQLTDGPDNDPATSRITGNIMLNNSIPQCVVGTAYLENDVTDVCTPLTVQFLPVLSRVRERDDTWNGNGTLEELDNDLVLSIVGATSRQIRFLNQCNIANTVEQNVTIYNTSGSSIPGEIIIVEDEPYSLGEQIRPQKLNITFVEGAVTSFEVGVRLLQPAAVDLYILMDVSSSFSPEFLTIQGLSSQIVQAVITNSSSDNTIGFGAFVDKPVSPYISEEPERLNNPCSVVDGQCEPTFDYNHLLSLTSDGDQFQSVLGNTPISANLDRPEATFDAILQATVCQEVIGWRESAQHIMLVLTDADFHSAGDGKLGGIVEPHDGQCYLTVDGSRWTYNRSTELDYPSPGQLASALAEFNIVPVFGVVTKEIGLYQSLNQQFFNGYTETLLSNSSNIVQVVQNILKTNIVKLVADPVAGLDIVVTPLCGNRSGDNCLVLENEEVRFNVTIHTKSCNDALTNGTTLQLRVPLIGVVDVAVQCVTLPPPVPAPALVTNISTSVVQVTWTRLINANVSAYTIFDGGNVLDTISSTGQETQSYNITGLSPYQLVRITITATNIAGTSNHSVEVTGRSSEDVPGIVEAIASSLSNTRTQVSWDPPIMPNGIITGYQVIYSLNENNTRVTSDVLNNATRTFTIEQLEPAVLYQVVVVAFTSAGKGVENAPKVFFNEQMFVPPMPPQNVKFDRLNATAIIVTWDPVTVTKEQGIPLYLISAYPSNTGSSRRKRQAGVITVTTPDTNVVISDLDPNTIYTVVVSVSTNRSTVMVSGRPVIVETTTMDGTNVPDNSDGSSGLDGVTIAFIILFATSLVIIVSLVVMMIVLVRNGGNFLFYKSNTNGTSTIDGHQMRNRTAADSFNSHYPPGRVED